MTKHGYSVCVGIKDPVGVGADELDEMGWTLDGWRSLSAPGLDGTKKDPIDSIFLLLAR
jgi:hypothetical protein